MLLILLTVGASTHVIAQGPPQPPATPDGHGFNGNKDPGQGAPIGDGWVILTGLAIGFYGIKSKKSNSLSSSNANLSVLPK